MKLRNQIQLPSERNNGRQAYSQAISLNSRNGASALTSSDSTKKTRASTVQEILVPVTFDDTSEFAVDVAIDMAKKMDCSVLLVHVAERHYGEGLLGSEHRQLAQLQSVETAAEELKRFADEKRNADVPIRWLVKAGLPSLEILRLAETEKAKWIVLGRPSRNVVSRMLLGSVSSDIVDCSPCPVLIVNRVAQRLAT